MTEAAPSARVEPGWEVLGGLRFALAFIVACGHLFRFVPGDGATDRALLRVAALDAVAAVFGFLVISGFCIAHSVATRPEGFLRRRVLRIYPLYLAGVAASLLPFLLVGPRIATVGTTFSAPDPLILAGNVLMLQGFLVPPLPANGPLWTLPVEVFLYLLAPVLVGMRTRRLMAAIAVSAAAFAAYPALELPVFGLPFYSELPLGLPVLLLGWAWLAGFVLHRHRHDPAWGLGVALLGALLFSVNTEFNTPYAVPTFVAAALVVAGSHRLRLPAAAARAAAYLGELSYPLYVIHVPVFLLAHAWLGVRDGAAMVGLALLAAAALHHLLDRPIRGRGAAGLRSPALP